jgi:hypothetical protein
LIFGVYRHFQQYFSSIMATSLSGGRSRSTWREPPTMGKQLVDLITCGCESSAPVDLFRVWYCFLHSITRVINSKIWNYCVRVVITREICILLYISKPKISGKKVLLLGGCVQPTLAPNINHSVKNILTKLGYKVEETLCKESDRLLFD